MDETKETHLLVSRGEIDAVLADLITERERVIADVDKLLAIKPDSPNLIKNLEKQKKQAEAELVPLRAGYLPIEGGWFWNLTTKSKWLRKAVKDVLDTMPAEVKQKMEEESKSGTFEKLQVSGSRHGDPMLVGYAGKRNFLLAMWCNFRGGYAAGFVVRRRIPLCQ